ncbi:response regulator transcription factor [Parapedobacter indicus]|nr:LuxR C-terminal-related transcriptional regulator [Parapedobacter indicus]
MKREIFKFPEAMKALAEWENLLPEDHVPRFIACNLGGLDDKPDITVDGVVNYTEYVDCRLRGTCRFEGKLCRALKVEHGVISGAEMAVLKLSNKPIKIIADELNISQETVKSHLKSIKDKTGLPDKTEVAIFAYKKALITQ